MIASEIMMLSDDETQRNFYRLIRRINKVIEQDNKDNKKPV